MHKPATINKDILSSQFFHDQCCLIKVMCANSLFWFQFCWITVYSAYSYQCSDLFLIIFVCWSHFCVLTVFTDHSCLHSDFFITFMSSHICLLITCLIQYYLTTFMIAHKIEDYFEFQAFCLLSGHILCAYSFVW